MQVQLLPRVLLSASRATKHCKIHLFRWRPYRVECTGSLPTSDVKRRRARLVLGWGTAREDLRVLPAFVAAGPPLFRQCTRAPGRSNTSTQRLACWDFHALKILLARWILFGRARSEQAESHGPTAARVSGDGLRTRSPVSAVSAVSRSQASGSQGIKCQISASQVSGTRPPAVSGGSLLPFGRGTM